MDLQQEKDSWKYFMPLLDWIRSKGSCMTTQEIYNSSGLYVNTSNKRFSLSDCYTQLKVLHCFGHIEHPGKDLTRWKVSSNRDR
jgi:hypothetical protein